MHMPTNRTISGLLALVIICAPLVIAPLRFKQSATFVREIENRKPNRFPKVRAARDLIDAAWWARVSGAIEDRAPFREQAVTLQHIIRKPINDTSRSEDVAAGKDNWLFLRTSLTADFVKPERVESSFDIIEQIMAYPERSAEIYFLAPPDKASLYPEQLSRDSFAEYEPSIPMRAALHEWFAKPNQPERIDLFQPMLDAKARSEVPIYGAQSSHCTSVASMVIAREMISSVDPELWDESFVEIRERGTRVPELARVAGLLHYRETRVEAFVLRPGVNCVALTRNGKPVKKKITDHTIGKFVGYNDLHSRSESAKLEMIPGKTLIIHDSFVTWYLMPTLSQFYEDIRFVHFRLLTDEILLEAMTSYDRIYFESVERLFSARIQKHFKSFVDD